MAGSSIKRDTDSDSGISIEISSNTTSSMTPIPPPIPMPILLEPLTTEEQVRSLPNYTLMVQEAIIALGMDFLIDGQISSYCPNQHEGELLTLIMNGSKFTQSS